MSLPTKSCHNCQRRRLRCDRSIPQCRKCTNVGQECLGYQALLVWTSPLSSRRKMSQMANEDKQTRPGLESQLLPSISPNIDITTTTTPDNFLRSVPLSTVGHSVRLLQARHKVHFEDDFKLSATKRLTEPFFQDLNYKTRFYISYFNSNVCQDLVIYDIPEQNPFRDLIPLATQHGELLNIIVANSALHISNASQRSLHRPVSVDPELRVIEQETPQHMIPQISRSSSWYRDALIAKQCALQFLNSALNDINSNSVDIALGSVLLFIEFELADSSANDSKSHIHGARALINSIKELHMPQNSDMSSLRHSLVSNCLVYDVLSSAFAHSGASEFLPCSSFTVDSSLQYAEGNNYLSFPAILLKTILAAAKLSQTFQDSSSAKSITASDGNELLSLLHTAQSFDAQDWASAIQKISPQCDLEGRAHVASAHKSAVCIYISRVLLSLFPSTEVHDSAELLVSDIIFHLSLVTYNSELFKATSWPTFIAGAEAKDLAQQSWAMKRLRELWERLPCTMGYVRSAMEILEGIWNRGDATGERHSKDWIQDLKLLEINCMIA